MSTDLCGSKRKIAEIVKCSTTVVKEAGNDDVDDHNLTDTEAAVSLIIQCQSTHRLCKGALVHQVYSVLSNKTSVDSEILLLRRNGGIRLLQFELNSAAAVKESQFLMSAEDYKSDLNEMSVSAPAHSTLRLSLQRFIPIAYRYFEKLSILETELLEVSSSRGKSGSAEKNSKLDSQLSPENVEEMIAVGFLSRRTDNFSSTSKVLWFSHPILRTLRQWIYSTRKDITVTMLSNTK